MPQNTSDRQARVLGRMMPQSPRKSPQNAVFRVFSKIPRSRKKAPRKIEKVLLPRLGDYWPRKDSVPGTEFPQLSAFFPVAVFTLGKDLLTRLAGVCWFERGSDYTLLGWPPSRLRSDTDQKNDQKKLGKRHRSSILVIGAFDHNVYSKCGKNMQHFPCLACFFAVFQVTDEADAGIRQSCQLRLGYSLRTSQVSDCFSQFFAGVNGIFFHDEKSSLLPFGDNQSCFQQKSSDFLPVRE